MGGGALPGGTMPEPDDSGAGPIGPGGVAASATPPNGNLGAAPPEARYGGGSGGAGPPTGPPASPPSASPPPSAAGGDAEPVEPGTMTILEHLEELRERIIKAGLAIIVGMIVSAIWLSGRVLEWLIALGLGAGSGLQNINPPAVFFEYLKITLFVGVALAMPVVIYQAMMFVLPALTPKEKRYAFVIVPGSAVCFAAGVAFGYYVLLPTGLGFLQSFAGQYVATNWDISLFLGFVTTLLFWMGVAFQTPLVVFILVRLGVVSAARLGSYRKYALLVAFVIAAIITPTPDPITQTLVGVPLYLLYELGLLLARFVK